MATVHCPCSQCRISQCKISRLSVGFMLHFIVSSASAPHICAQVVFVKGGLLVIGRCSALLLVLVMATGQGLRYRSAVSVICGNFNRLMFLICSTIFGVQRWYKLESQKLVLALQILWCQGGFGVMIA